MSEDHAEYATAMTPTHPRWPEFIARLSGREGLGLRREGGDYSTSLAQGDPPQWFTCDHTFEKAMAILKSMGVDISATLEYFESEGAYCDCEIILN